MFAGKFTAGARALESDIVQVDGRLVRIFPASLAKSPDAAVAAFP